MDVSAHRKVDEDEDIELDEDGEAEKDGVQDEAGQAQSPVQSPFVQMDTENLQEGQRQLVTSSHLACLKQSFQNLELLTPRFGSFAVVLKLVKPELTHETTGLHLIPSPGPPLDEVFTFRCFITEDEQGFLCNFKALTLWLIILVLSSFCYSCLSYM